jgi:hypothetical protein
MRRALAGLLLALVGGWLLAGLAATGPASAAPFQDSVDSVKIGYTVTPDGVLKVREEIVYRFGEQSGRHGIYRDLIVREPYVDDDSRDQRYDVSNVHVSSPSGDSAKFSKSTTTENHGRFQVLRIKIGSADKVITADTATYVISYDVRGALRHFADHSELYWDATGNAWAATLNNVSVQVTVPQGVQKVACFAGPSGSTTSCHSARVVGDKGEFGENALPTGYELTIVAGIKAGVVSNDAPIVVDPPSWMERNGVNVPMLGGAGLVTLGVPFVGMALGRRATRDDRFAGLPPGSFPPTGANVAIGKDTLDEDQLPVSFAPPRIPVAEAGLLIDAVANTHETAATLIDLAVRGGIRIDNSGHTRHAVLLNPAVATAPHEQALIGHLYPGLQPGTAIALKRRPVGDTSMRNAHDAMIAAVRQQVTAAGYYNRMPSRMRSGGLPSKGFGCAFGAMVALWIGGGILMSGIAAIAGAGASSGGGGRIVVIGLPLAVIAGTLALLGWMRSRGRRTAVGRAMTDQTVGFRTYLATAEADQLRFEEGEDIFSRYLPWAIVFDLADRWQKVCEKLVAAGRIPADPYWYTGPSYYGSGWTAGSISDTVSRTFDPPPTPSSSGGGSSSGFSGGSSGGGGGGGGGGSW